MKPLNRELIDPLPIARYPEQIQIFVAGGAGKHSMFMAGFSGKPVTVRWTPHKQWK